MKSGKSSVSSLFGPLQRKTFAAALSQFFEEQCPQMGGQLTRDMLVKNIQQLTLMLHKISNALNRSPAILIKSLLFRTIQEHTNSEVQEIT